MTTDFRTILAEVATNAPGGTGGQIYRGRRVGSADRHYFGRDKNGFPCLLISSPDSASRAPIRLAVLDIRFSIPCRVVLDSGEEASESLTVISCCSHDAEINSYFAHIAEMIVRIVGPTPLTDVVAEAVRRLIRLFESMTRPSGRSVAGLFGELYSIHISRSPKISVEAWRSSTDDRFDFSIGNARMEVKSASDRVRAHSFSRDQCMSPSGTVAALLSLFVETNGGGTSLQELIQRIEAQLDGNQDLILKVHEVIASTLGQTAPMALSIRFDEQLSRSSLKIYDLTQIPAIREGLPVELSQVHFRSDISHCPSATIEELGERCSNLLRAYP